MKNVIRVVHIYGARSLTLLLIVTLSLSPLGALAQAGSDFQVELRVANTDVTAPTTPTGLVATALSISAIELDWNASSDDFGVAGYQVFRDGVAIATTSSTDYSDTGLQVSTLYSYTVRAFDASSNYSGHSATATATTLGDGTTDGDDDDDDDPRYTLKISDLSVAVEMYHATISWTTSENATACISWGETGDYELGTSNITKLARTQTVRIENLTPDTLYHFELVVSGVSGQTVTLSNQTFRTRSLPDTQAPANPSDFRAVPKNTFIDLSWKNPKDTDFADVRLVRSDKFFPVDIFDGEVIYEGKGQSFKDTDVQVGKVYYYTLFARDENGNFSSGVVALAVIPHPFEEGPDKPYVETPTIPSDPFSYLPQSPLIDPLIDQLTLADFEFIQDGKVIYPENGTLAIEGNKNLTIRIGYDRVPEILKTIGISLTDPSDSSKVFAFILRVDENKEYYSATIGSLERSGKYPLNVTVVDFKNRGLKRLQGALIVEALSHEAEEAVFGATLWIWTHLVRYLLIPFFVLILLLALLKRRKKRQIEPVDHGAGEIV